MDETNILDTLSSIEETINIAPVEQEERVTESSNSILSEEDEAFLNEIIENQHLEIPPIAEITHDEKMYEEKIKKKAVERSKK